MKMQWLFTILIFSALHAQAQLRCEAVFTQTLHVVNADERERIVTELTNMQLDIIEMPESSAKVIALNEYKAKFKEMSTILGSGLKKEVAQRVALGRVHRVAETAHEHVREMVARAEAERIMHWSHLDLHPGIEAFGPFVDNHRALVSIHGMLFLYDVRRKLAVGDRLNNVDPSLDAAAAAKLRLSEHSVIKLTPDREYAVLIHEEAVQVIHLKTGKEVHEIFEQKGVVMTLDKRLSKDGKFVFIAGANGLTKILTVPDLQPILSSNRGKVSGARGVVQSPDGRYVYFAREDGSDGLFDMKLGGFKSLRELTGSLISASRAVFADSQTLVVVDSERKTFEYDLVSKQLKPSPLDIGDNVYFVISEDGRWIAARTTDTEPFVLTDRSTGQRVPVNFGGHKFKEMSKFFVVGGRLLFTSSVRDIDGQVVGHFLHSFDFNSGDFAHYPVDLNGGSMLKTLEMSPDGRSVVLQHSAKGFVELH